MFPQEFHEKMRWETGASNAEAGPASEHAINTSTVSASWGSRTAYFVCDRNATPDLVGGGLGFCRVDLDAALEMGAVFDADSRGGNVAGD
jgi:hypothetical protein